MKNGQRSKTSIYIGIPNMGEIETELSIRLLEWQQNRHYHIFLRTPAYIRPIPAARNQIVADFLQTDFEFLLMNDSDVVPPPDILDLAGFRKDIISPLIFVRKDNDVPPMLLKKNDEGELTIMKKFELNSLYEVDAVGTGCIMIHQRVFYHLEKPYFKYRMTPDGKLDLGEDFDFCERAKARNLKVFAHTGYIAKHFGKIDLSWVGMNLLK